MMPGLTGWEGFKLWLAIMTALALEALETPQGWLVVGAVLVGVAWGILT